MDAILEKIDKDLYALVIDIIGFLKTLQKKGVENQTTATLAKLTSTLNKRFNNFYENKGQKDEIKKIAGSLIEQIKFILIKNFEDIDRSIIHEKADLLIQADELQKYIEKNL